MAEHPAGRHDGADRSPDLSERLKQARPRRFVAPAAVLALGLFCTLVAGVAYDRVAAERDAQRFNSLVAQRVISIDERMSRYVGLLRGLAAYVGAEDAVTRAGFAAFVEGLRIARDYPGVQGVGYAAALAPGDEPALAARMRAQGRAGFRVWPRPAAIAAGVAGPRSAIVFLEPEDSRNRAAQGFDMTSEATRRAAMLRARDTGEPTASGRVTLVQEDATDPQPGFLVYLPVYDGGAVPDAAAARAAGLQGWVFAPFRAGDLFDRALAMGRRGELDVAVFDGESAAPQGLLFRTGETHDRGRLGFRTAVRIAIADRPWTLVLETTPLFERASPRVFTPFIVLAGAVVTGLLTGGSVRQAWAVDAAETARADVEELNQSLEHRVERRTAQLERARTRLAELNVDLERAVQARTAELTAANDEIQRFAYIVSHDLRSPLVNVMGFTSELEAVRADVEAFIAEVAGKAPQIRTDAVRSAIETDLPEALGFIRASTQKMDRLINAILKLSREGRRVLAAEHVDMQALVETLRESHAHQLAEREVDIVVGALPPVRSDRLALEQIFGNIVENAVKYLVPARPGRVSITAVDAGPLVRYAVADNGRGIDPGDFERIFDLFRRAGRQDVAGEGIGLAHTRALVRRLGGTIEVASTPGEGSTFTITLPRVLDDRAQTTTQDAEGAMA